MNEPTPSVPVTPSRHANLAAITLIAVMLAGAAQIIMAARDPAGLEFPRTWTDFREGRSTGELQKQLDQKLPARDALIATANSLRYLIAGGAGEQVRTGRDDWLFLADELRFEADGGAHLNARAELLGSTSQRLERQGVKLVVALVPDKARLYSAKLAGGAYPGYLRSRYPDALAALRGRGVTVVDLLAPLTSGAQREEVYYRSDTHWNQTGAQIAAAAVAQSVQQLGLDLEKTAFVTAPGGTIAERPGDLIRMMGLESMPNALRPRPDSEAAVVTQQSSPEVGGGLFDKAVVPVVLTGTSYSLRGNFHGYLQQALSAKVLNAAKDGGGFLQATGAYLTNEAFATDKPKVLIWELPERFLLAPLADENEWLGKVGLK